MSHYITVPLNENGVITDEYIQDELKVVCTQRFGITDVFLYSHGWWTSAVAALADYNRFSVNFADKTLEIAAIEPPPLARLRQTKAFGVGLHWPSMLSENTGSLIDKLEAMSFYTMEKRADTIGHHGLYAIIRMAVEANQAGDPPLRFHFLGHSFGCKVVCAALQAVADATGGKFYRATDTDSLQKIYEQINRLEKNAQTVQKFEHTEELYSWALIPALAILGLSLLLQQTRLRRLP